MAQNPKNTDDAAKKIIRSSLSSAYKIFLSNENIVGETFDETKINAPSVLIHEGDMSGVVQPVSPDIQETSNRVGLTHLAQIGLSKADVDSLISLVKSKKIEQKVEEEIAKKITAILNNNEEVAELIESRRHFIKGQLDLLKTANGKMWTYSRKLRQMIDYGRKPDVMRHTSFLSSINFLSNPGTHSTFQQGLYEPIDSQLRTTNFHEWVILNERVNPSLDVQTIDLYAKVKNYFKSGNLVDNRYNLLPFNIDRKIPNRSLSAYMYQLLYDIKFSLDYGVTPELAYTSFHLQDSLLSLNNPDSTYHSISRYIGENPTANYKQHKLLSEVGYYTQLTSNGDLQYTTQAQHTEYFEAFVNTLNAAQRSFYPESQLLGPSLGGDNQTYSPFSGLDVVFPGANDPYGPSLYPTAVSSNPDKRVSDYLDSLIKTDGTALDNLAIIASAIGNEAMLSRRQHEDPTERGGAGYGSYYFGETVGSVLDIDGNQTPSPNEPGTFKSILKSKLSPGPDAKDVFFYERNINPHTEDNGVTDLYNEFLQDLIKAKTSEERKAAKDKIYNALSDQDTYVATMYEKIKDLCSHSDTNQTTNVNTSNSQEFQEEIPNPVEVVGAITGVFEKILDALVRHHDNTFVDGAGETLYEQSVYAIVRQAVYLYQTAYRTNPNCKGFKNTIAPQKKDLIRKDLRKLIINGVINRDIFYSENSSPGDYQRKVLYSPILAGRRRARYRNFDVGSGNLDNKRVYYNGDFSGRLAAIRWLELLEHQGCSGGSVDLLEANYVLSPAEKGRWDAYHQAADSIRLERVAGEINGNKEFDSSGMYDLYDYILEAVDHIDQALFKNASNSVRNPFSFDNTDDAMSSNYFDTTSGGLTSHSGFDRSVLIAFVVDGVAELLGSTIYTNQWHGPSFNEIQEMTKPEYVLNAQNLNLLCGFEITTTAFNRQWDWRRDRQQDVNYLSEAFDSDRVSRLTENTNSALNHMGEKFVDTPVLEVPKGLSLIRAIAQVASIANLTKVLGNALGNLNQVPNKGQLESWMNRNFVSLSSGQPRHNYRLPQDENMDGMINPPGLRYDIIGENDLHRIFCGVYLSTFTQEAVDMIIRVARSSMVPRKLFNEFIFLHHKYTYYIRRALEGYDDLVSPHQNPIVPNEVTSSLPLLSKKFWNIWKIREAMDTTGGIYTRPFEDYEYTLVLKYLNQIRSEMDELGNNPTLDYILYGVKSEDNHRTIAESGDDPDAVGVDTSYNAYPQSFAIQMRGKPILDNDLILTRPIDDDRLIPKNLTFPEVQFFQSVTNKDTLANLENKEYQAIVDDLKLMEVYNAQTPVQSNNEARSKSFNDLTEEEGAPSGALGGLPLHIANHRRKARVLLDSFCVKTLFKMIFNLNYDEKIMNKGVQRTLDAEVLEGFASVADPILAAYGISIQDIIDKMTEEKYEVPDEDRRSASGGQPGQPLQNFPNFLTKRKAIDEEFQSSLSPTAAINSDGEPVVVAPRISEYEIILSDIIFSSMIFKNPYYLLGGKNYFDEIVVHSFSYNSDIDDSTGLFNGIFQKPNYYTVDSQLADQTSSTDIKRIIKNPGVSVLIPNIFRYNS